MIYYDEYGDRHNPTILLLHGAAATDTFCKQYCFQDTYQLVVPHLYGSGKEVDKVYDPEKQIEALVELIRHISNEKITIMGHSLGAELAVALVSRYPEFFNKAVFLSAWICPSEKSIRMYTKIAKFSCMTLKFPALVRWQANYWHYSKEQADFMVEYSKRITPEQYAAWFRYRVKLDELPEYKDVNIPMLAVCGSKELAEMKTSISELGRRNPNCQTIILDSVMHDFPMRFPQKLNPILLDFLAENRTVYMK